MVNESFHLFTQQNLFKVCPSRRQTEDPSLLLEYGERAVSVMIVKREA